jgi:phenylpyruvate tautomerase PptA (4-oxalocrotonate tautomerase family)
MPVSYIDVPHGISPADKEQLVKAVSEAIHEAPFRVPRRE